MRYVALIFPRASTSAAMGAAVHELASSFKVKRTGRFVPGSASRARALLQCIYGDKGWFGQRAMKRHLRKKFGADALYDRPVCFFVFKTGRGLHHVVRCKKRIRRIFGIGTSSIHINDYRRETADMVAFLSKYA